MNVIPREVGATRELQCKPATESVSSFDSTFPIPDCPYWPLATGLLACKRHHPTTAGMRKVSA